MCKSELYEEKKDIPLVEIIEKFCEKTVESVRLENPADKKLIEVLFCIAQKTRSSIPASTINRAGNNMITKIKNFVREENLSSCDEEGKITGKAMTHKGYPDLFFCCKENEQDNFYYIKIITVNTINKKKSSPRTFPISVSSARKRIKENARHLGISFVVEKGESDVWNTKEIIIVDLSTLPCKNKYEWSSDNLKLHHSSRILKEMSFS